MIIILTESQLPAFPWLAIAGKGPAQVECAQIADLFSTNPATRYAILRSAKRVSDVLQPTAPVQLAVNAGVSDATLSAQGFSTDQERAVLRQGGGCGCGRYQPT